MKLKNRKNADKFQAALHAISLVRDEEELRELNKQVIGRIKDCRFVNSMETKSRLYKGAKVKVMESDTVSRKGQRLYGKMGEIIRLGRTKAKVQFEGDHTIWSIPFHMLEVNTGGNNDSK